MESGPEVGGGSLCGLLSSKKAFGGISPKGIYRRHTGVFYWIDPSAASPMCAFDLFSCHLSESHEHCLVFET